MGRDLSGPEFLETNLSEYLVAFFGPLDAEWERIEVAPGRSNVIARIDRPESATTILLDAHQDTVPVDGMTVDPFCPVVQDGRVAAVELVRQCGFAASNSEARRLIAEKGIRVNGEPIKDPHDTLPIKSGDIVQRGKRKFVRIQLSSP